MRKKIFAVLVVAAGVAFAGYNVINSQDDEKMLSDLVLANVEALARGELPEVEITCGQSGGKCWATYGDCLLAGLIRYDDCIFMGYMDYSCSTPCD